MAMRVAMMGAWALFLEVLCFNMHTIVNLMQFCGRENIVIEHVVIDTEQQTMTLSPAHGDRVVLPFTVSIMCSSFLRRC